MSHEALILAKALCEAHGYAVLPAGKWVTPTALGQSHGLKATTMHKLLHSPDCPHYEAHRGRSGRLIHIRETAALRNWLKRQTKPERKAA